MLRRESKLKIAYGCVLFFIVAYAAAVLIRLGVRYGAGEVASNLFGVGCICAAFCGVTVFSYLIVRNNRSGRKKKPARNPKEGEQERVPKKSRLAEWIVFAVCLCVSAVLIAWAVTGFGTFAGLGNVLGGGYVKTQATLVQSVSSDGNLTKPVYEYVSADGNVYRSAGEASFGGIVFEAGRKVTIYYLAEDPRVAANLSTPIVLLSGALLFLTGGICWVLANGKDSRNRFTGYAVFTFFVLFGVAFYFAAWLASGLNAFELCVSGAAFYGVTLFMLVGVLLDALGLVAFVKRKRVRKSERAERENVL